MTSFLLRLLLKVLVPGLHQRVGSAALVSLPIRRAEAWTDTSFGLFSL